MYVLTTCPHKTYVRLWENVNVVVVVVVVGRSWQATNVLQPVGLSYRPLWTFQLFATRCPRAPRHVPHSSGGSWNYYEREQTD
jgi:hypothetical protein